MKSKENYKKMSKKTLYLTKYFIKIKKEQKEKY